MASAAVPSIFSRSSDRYPSSFRPICTRAQPSIKFSTTAFDSIKKTTTFLLLAGGLLVPVDQSSIASSTRLFSIMFYDPNNGGSSDPNNVAKISILNKAYELSQVIKQINAITKTKDSHYRCSQHGWT